MPEPCTETGCPLPGAGVAEHARGPRCSRWRRRGRSRRSSARAAGLRAAGRSGRSGPGRRRCGCSCRPTLGLASRAWSRPTSRPCPSRDRRRLVRLGRRALAGRLWPTSASTSPRSRTRPRRRGRPAAVERRADRAGERLRARARCSSAVHPDPAVVDAGGGGRDRGAAASAPTCTSTPTCPGSCPRWTPRRSTSARVGCSRTRCASFRRAGRRPRRGHPRPRCASSTAGRASSRRRSPAASATAGARRRCPVEALDGLPDDFVAEHPADADGTVEISTDYPDTIPFLTYARDPDARRAVAHSFLNLGWPENDAGPRRAARGARGEGPPARVRRLAELRRRGEDDRRGRRDPGVHRRDRRGLGRGRPPRDRRAARRAPGRGRGRHRLLQLAAPPRERSSASGSASTPRRCAATSTSPRCAPGPARRDRPALRAGLRAGRRPDLAPRRHVVRRAAGREPASCSAGSTSTCTRATASSTTPRSSPSSRASRGRQLAEGVLVCNFPRGLMDHDDVVTLFHEFGHLMHHVLAGRHEWVRFSGVATEWDFVEAPSQMLEEWAWDPARAADLRDRRRRHADPGRPGRPDAGGRRVRQGLPGPHPDGLRRDLLLVPRRSARPT